MRDILRWSLWLWITLCTLGAFYWAPLAEGFVGQSSRILFFHVPMAWASFLGFMAAGVWSVLYLVKDRRAAFDHRAGTAIEVAFVFCILATVTGAIWAKVMWGAYWNWDPRQTSITVTLLFYAAYLVFRSAVEDPERRATLSAAYASLGLIVAPFFYFILPRITFSLHPDTVINTQGKVDMDSKMLLVLLASLGAYSALFFWIHRLRVRQVELAAHRLER